MRSSGPSQVISAARTTPRVIDQIASHRIGTETGAPAAGRVLNGATNVLLMAFCVKSSRVLPFRLATSLSQLTISGTVSPIIRDSFSTQARVSSKV